MLALAGQTAGSNGLTFFEGTLEYPGSKKAKKLFFFKFCLDVSWMTEITTVIKDWI